MKKKQKDIISRLHDLHKQATTEYSHFYTASVVKEAIVEIIYLRSLLKDARKRRAHS